VKKLEHKEEEEEQEESEMSINSDQIDSEELANLKSNK